MKSRILVYPYSVSMMYNIAKMLTPMKVQQFHSEWINGTVFVFTDEEDMLLFRRCVNSYNRLKRQYPEYAFRDMDVIVAKGYSKKYLKSTIKYKDIKIYSTPKGCWVYAANLQQAKKINIILNHTNPDMLR